MKMNPIEGVYVIPDFLNEDEINTFLNMTFPDESFSFNNSGKFKNGKWMDTSISTMFYDKLIQIIKEDRGRPFIGANDVIMMGEYKKDDIFGLHTDTGLYYNRKENKKSCWTLLIYLNDDFIGGTTSFYNDQFELTTTIIPKKGTALLFDIDLWHKGDQLYEGYKKWIGCEIIGNII